MNMNLNIKKISNIEISKLKLVKNGDCGHFGRVYRLNRKECLKVFNTKFNDKFVKVISEQTKFSFDNVEMPKQLVEVDGTIKGYITNYIKGNNLVDSLDCDYTKFLIIYSNFIKNATQEISSEKYLITDASSTNIMINNRQTLVKLVDTDLWRRRYDLSCFDIVEKNFNELNAAVFNRFLFLLNYDLFKLKINDDFVDYYECVREDIEKKRNVKIKTLGDLLNANK